MWIERDREVKAEEVRGSPGNFIPACDVLVGRVGVCHNECCGHMDSMGTRMK